MTYHYTQPYLLAPVHKVTINLVGLGGTGSQVLTGLARINEALIALNHPGIHVRCFDHDVVSRANVGRQMFSPADINQSKATVLVTRINRYFGYDWEAYPKKYEGDLLSNILITCVDTAKARKEIFASIKPGGPEPHEVSMYWMDYGNSMKTGQVIIGTVSKVKQPQSSDKTVGTLKNVLQFFPELKKRNYKESNEPSCSLAEALGKQDLFINSTLAQFGLNILWKMFREGRISYHGCFLNLDTMNTNPIKI